MKLYKYCASGNDFLIYCDENAFFEPGETPKKRAFTKALIKRLCLRHEGIGADGFIIIKPHDEFAFKWEFYNADASKANMCGNGARSAAHFASKYLKLGSCFSFLAGEKLIHAKVENNEVLINLGKPCVIKKDIVLNDDYSTSLLGGIKGVIHASLIDTGVRHLVIFSKKIDDFDNLDLAKLRLDFDANINLYTSLENKLYVRTYERGVEGETKACGTGMMACFYDAFIKKRLDKSCDLIPLFKKTLKAFMKDEELYLQGKVSFVFTADIDF